MTPRRESRRFGRPRPAEVLFERICRENGITQRLTGPRFEAAVVLALAYGMRRGEVLGLHWSALDWEGGTVRVTHSVKRIKDRDASPGRRTRLVVSELKTPKSPAPPGAHSRAGGQVPATSGAAG